MTTSPAKAGSKPTHTKAVVRAAQAKRVFHRAQILGAPDRLAAADILDDFRTGAVVLEARRRRLTLGAVFVFMAG
jgi:hypothetical protein